MEKRTRGRPCILGDRKMTRVHFTMADTTIRMLDTLARQRGLSRSAVLRDALAALTRVSAARG